MDATFFVNSILLGIGLAMDAVSVSLVSGLREPDMKKRRMALIAGVFGGFQFLMPLAGWFAVTFLESQFSAIRPFIPWAAFAALTFLGVRMILAGLRKAPEERAVTGFGALLVQGIATSIDALSAGLATAGFRLSMAAVSSAVIGVVTFALCLAAVRLGRVFGEKLKGKSTVLGGVILVAIGIEILIKSFIGG